MQTQFAKWGNSLALRIPQSIAKNINAVEGSAVTITVENGVMVVRPVVPVYRIEDLVRGITSKNRHPEFDTGGPVGNEII